MSARGWTVLAALAVALVALNLRSPLVALPSVAGSVGAGLGVGAGALGLLTTLPVLCFGLGAPFASLLIARLGLFPSVLVALAALVVALVLRSVAGYAVAVTGTLVLGLAITVGNVALPVVIGELFPALVGVVTAGYTAMLNIGSTIASSLTPALSRVTGWRVALAAWGVLALLAAAAWGPLGRRHGSLGAQVGGPAAGDRPAWRRAGTWGLAAVFAGQAFSYYGATAWLPQLLHDERGMSIAASGSSAAIFQLTAVVGAFGLPVLLRTTGRPRLALQLICLAWITLPAGLLLAPGLWWLWCAFAGAAQGGGFTAVFVAVVARSTGPDDARRVSAAVQATGYVVGSLGPTSVGAAHDATGGWTASLLLVAAAVVLMVCAGTLVMPARTVSAAGPVR